MSKVNEAALRKRISVSTLNKMKQQGQKFSSLTAYDASFAKLFDDQGVHVLLIGDSLGNVVQGLDDTLGVTVQDIAYHTRCVRVATASALVVADLPFMSYATPEQACENAAVLMRAGAQMVKLEGGEWVCDTIRTLVERSVPVCAHIGLMPQSVHVMGGYKVQGKSQEDAERILREAKAVEAAGAQLLVIECVSQKVAKAVTEALSIPVIGIGAGPDTDGQVLVMHDMFGISAGHIPKFSKNFLIEAADMQSAVSRFVSDVAEGRFPAAEHSFD
ncbi:3-methyl-2-oxobutanoate hydroxymethyltransferase [Gallaecimonas xiamenensis]|uniref:3-methyl-2-oxobutanoate hydroxymethyltransferase n=1 Tax=Gallaecimonas xiamenensis 3-C-1 TaxID=745411 RepID=K2JF38_9GAMM|nr:3-methyl-2-oxobutanoate hydroxymethyltransferase [Gallaecimonas xiamenensis]EKE73688.1 3-methyl-2-oxobutanoate hydroxymethyltransferase [Gallaecimonas xiamenensis 3-C-1]